MRRSIFFVKFRNLVPPINNDGNWEGEQKSCKVFHLRCSRDFVSTSQRVQIIKMPSKNLKHA